MYKEATSKGVHLVLVKPLLPAALFTLFLCFFTMLLCSLFHSSFLKKINFYFFSMAHTCMAISVDIKVENFGKGW